MKREKHLSDQKRAHSKHSGPLRSNSAASAHPASPLVSPIMADVQLPFQSPECPVTQGGRNIRVDEKSGELTPTARTSRRNSSGETIPSPNLNLALAGDASAPENENRNKNVCGEHEKGLPLTNKREGCSSRVVCLSTSFFPFVLTPRPPCCTRSYDTNLFPCLGNCVQ